MRTLHALAFIFAALFAQPASAEFVAHEWGTFTSLVGSNGISQNPWSYQDGLCAKAIRCASCLHAVQPIKGTKGFGRCLVLIR